MKLAREKYEGLEHLPLSFLMSDFKFPPTKFFNKRELKKEQLRIVYNILHKSLM